MSRAPRSDPARLSYSGRANERLLLGEASTVRDNHSQARETPGHDGATKATARCCRPGARRAQIGPELGPLAAGACPKSQCDSRLHCEKLLLHRRAGQVARSRFLAINRGETGPLTVSAASGLGTTLGDSYMVVAEPRNYCVSTPSTVAWIG